MLLHIQKCWYRALKLPFVRREERISFLTNDLFLSVFYFSLETVTYPTDFIHDFPLLINYVIPLKYLLVLSLRCFCCRDSSSFQWIFLAGSEELKQSQALYGNSVLN